MNLEELNLEELTIEEKKSIDGGDEFLHDLGYAIGSFMTWCGDNFSGIANGMARQHR